MFDNPDAQRRIERYERLGKPVPADLAPPDLLPGYEDWIEAFWELGADRQLGQVAGPIPAASIARHTTDWPAHEASLFRRAIRAMDAIALKQMNGADEEGEPSDNPARDSFRAAIRG